jgi:predicted HAD superfamily Cof-like phosphohydrolase
MAGQCDLRLKEDNVITIEDMEAMGYAYYNEKGGDLTIPQMVDEFAKTTEQATDPDLSANLIREEYYEWHHEFFKSAPAVKELKELSDLTYVIFGYARARGWDLLEAVQRVHENNIGRCIQPDGSVQRRADGKIMKNSDYPSVVLDDLV